MCAHNYFRNVVLVQKAVCEAKKQVSIEDSRDWIANSILPDGRIDPGALRVDGDTLDAITSANDFDHIDLLKMNIEGAERYAIEGMTETIRRTSAVVIAAHDHRARGSDTFFRTKSLVRRFLEQNGFTTASRNEDNRPWVRGMVYGIRTSAQ